MEKRRVLITGLGTITPLGHNADDTWQAVKDGVCGIGPITHYDCSAQKVHLAAEVKDWDPTTVLDKKDVRHMSRYIQLAMTAAKECLADSGLNREQEDLTRCGVIVSSGVGGIEMAESETLRCSEKGYDRASPFYIPTTIANMGAGYIAILSGFQGKAFMPHVLQGDNLAAYLLLREFLAGNGTVLGMIRAIDATVHAIVGKVKRGKHHNAVAIEFPFDFTCQMIDALHQFRLVTFQQQGRLPMGKPLAQSSLVNQTFNERTVVAVCLRILQCIQYLLVIDEFFCLS